MGRSSQAACGPTMLHARVRWERTARRASIESSPEEEPILRARTRARPNAVRSDGADRLAMMADQLVVHGAREHNLKTSPSRSRGTARLRDRALRAPASPAWPSTPSTPRVSAGTWSRSRRSAAVPREDGEAGLRPHPRAVAGDRDRAEDDLVQPRSTVGTVTEIYDYLRVLYARAGGPTAPMRRPIAAQSLDQIVDQLLTLPEGPSSPSSPRPAHRKGEYRDVLEEPAAPASRA